MIASRVELLASEMLVRDFRRVFTMDQIIQTEVNIVITPRTQEYLKKSNCQEIMIDAINVDSCCIPIIAPPEVRKGMPMKPERYRLIEKEGISIYYEKVLPLRPQITIDTQGFGFIKTLRIADWEIKI